MRSLFLKTLFSNFFVFIFGRWHDGWLWNGYGNDGGIRHGYGNDGHGLWVSQIFSMEQGSLPLT